MKIISAELYRRFQAMRTYGKEPESLESIVTVFLSDLADFPAGKVMQAIRLHSQRSAEFPTVADIAGILKRNGRPPMSEAMYVTISRKDYENRTPAERAYMRDFEAERQEEFAEFQPLPADTARHHGENEALRAVIRSLRQEVARLTRMLHDTRLQAGLEKPEKPCRRKST